MNLSGSPLDYAVVFLGGILLSFTPCVYPLIPISIAYIGVTATTSKLKGFTLSLSYITGMAVTYATLGLVASLSGRLFGSINAHPVTQLIAGALIVVFGLGMFDFFHITLPSWVRLPSLKKGSHLSTFMVGIVSGLMIGPCTTPVLGSILVYLTTKKNILYGTTLLFTFAYGMGMLLLAAGMFGSLLLRLPKSGAWLVVIQRIGACLIVGMGVFVMLSSLRRF